MKKMLIIILTCMVSLVLDYAVKAEGIAGINVILDNVNPEELNKILNIKYMWTTTKAVNLRSEPNTNSNIIITLDKRSKVIFLKEVSDKWMQVKYNDQEGYIYSKYLRDTELPSLNFTDEEIEMLQRITEAECRDCSITAKSNVASVIINRILSLDFPDSTEEVIFQESQFSPVGNGSYFKVNITDETIIAVNQILNNGVTHEGLYFCNMKLVKNKSTLSWFKNDLTYLFTDDAHSFFK